MPDLTSKEPTEITELSALKEAVVALTAKVKAKDTEIKQASVKKHASIGYYRSRFK